MNNLHETPTLKEALQALPTVETVNYEFPGYWVITLINGKNYYLGDVNGPWGWDDGEGNLSGDTYETEGPAIAEAFNNWVKGLQN